MPKRLFVILFCLFSIIIFIAWIGRHEIKNFWLLIFHLSPRQTINVPSALDSAVKITFLDIGQGDASFIELPSGEQILVDCALDARILSALGRVMQWRDRTIDYLIVSHPDQDHYGGCVDVLERFTVKHIVVNGYTKENSNYFSVFQNSVDKEPAQVVEVNTPQEWKIGSSTLHFLFPDAPVDTHPALQKLPYNKISNNTSIVFLLRFGNQSALFTGDAESEEEAYLLGRYGSLLNADILKVGHHGSKSSSGEDFLRVVTPQIATISVGKENDYGHPSARVLKRLERSGAKIWRTDQKGDIIIYMFPHTLYASDV